MELLFLIGFIYCIFILPGKVNSKKFDNYMPPKGYMIDYGKMNTDLASGMSESEIYRNTLAGKYNIPIPDCSKPSLKNS